MTLTIKGVFDKTDYSRELTPMNTTDVQTLWLDIGQLAPRAEVLNLIAGTQIVPKISQQHSSYSWLYCKKVTIKQWDEIPNVWIINVLWQSLDNIQDTILDPTKKPALISRGTYKQQDIPNKDFDGKPVATNAGEPINYTYQRGFATYTIQKNLSAFPTWCAKDNDFVNVDSVTIYGAIFNPWELFLPEISIGHAEYINNTVYYPATFTLYANTKPDGWRTKLRNAGYHERSFLGYFTRQGQELKTGALFDTPSPTANGNIRIGNTIYYPRWGLAAIKMGTKGKYEYPTSPILLDKYGMAFRQKLPSDPSEGPFRGPVIGLQSTNNQATTSGITQAQWDAAVVEIRVANTISFNSYLPLR